MNTKRALVCSFYTPQPDRDSSSRSISDFIDHLRETGWAVTFVSFHEIAYDRYARALQQRGVAVYDRVNSQIDQLLTAVRFDVVLLVSWPIAEFYLPIIRRISPATRVLVASLDLHFLRDARRILGEASRQEASSLLDGDYASQMIGELNTYAAADGVLAVSRKEADLLNDLVGDTELAHVAPDAEDLRPSNIPFAERRGVVFLGCFRHPPNVQALEYLCKEVLPRLDPKLMSEHPIYIVGDGLNPTMRSYGNELPGVRMVGWVPSVEPYFERARISVVPLLYGAGTKRKMVQTLMTGTPSVSTSVGIEGLNLRNEEHVLVADDPASFAESIVRLLEDKKLWQRLARNGYGYISEIYGRKAAQARFKQAISAILSKEAKPPMLSESPRELYQERANYQYYQQLVPHIRQVVINELPHGSTVMVVSKGDDELLKLDGRQAWHFPQTEDGVYAGYHPADSAEAISHLEELRGKGGDFLLFPSTEFWWLDYYEQFKHHLDSHYREVIHEKNVCLAYALREPSLEQPPAPEATIQQHEAVDLVGSEPSKKSPTLSQAVQERSTPAILDLVTGTDRTSDNGSPTQPEHHSDVRLIAFYLPQFHPIPENNAWWGEGFTEWTNVAKAQPLFPEHYQPRLPADLGFYDLRLPEVRQKQADLAKEYGIHGFCYYHFWFDGKRLLDRPFSEVLSSGEPDFPFCLCWANEPWSRRWDGRPRDVLQPQSYGEEDDVAHILWLIPALRDPRAIKIEGKPVFLVYQGRELPDPARTIETWRREVLKAGLEGIYLIAVETGWDAGWDATQEGFDAKVLFMPQFSILRTTPRIPMGGRESLQVYDYHTAWPILAHPEPAPYRRYDTVFPSWDNSPRAGDNATVLHNSTPEAYKQWLSQAIARAQPQPPDHRIVFINAWNEWAESTYLEPDMRHGRAYLDATRQALVSQQPRKSSL
jgi:glycosyltransferase involved in cell wall biosynthesis